MATTVIYSLQFVKNLDAGPATAAADVTSLVNGGFAVLGDHTGHIDGVIFTPNGSFADDWAFAAGTNGALDQLANGRIVMVSQDADSVLFKVFSTVTGVVATADLGDANTLNADVAALPGGGFWIVYEDEIGAVGGDADIEISIRADDGDFVDSVIIDGTSARETGASVAALPNGNVAVAWTRTIIATAETEVWYAVYKGNGDIVKAPALFDTDGTINRNVSVSVRSSGGFVIAYEDNSGGEDVDITLAQFNSAGAFGGAIPEVGQSVLNDSNPYVTLLANGLLALTHTTDAGDTDTYVKLIDPIGDKVLAARLISGGQGSIDEVDNSVVSRFGEGRIAVFHRNLTDSSIDGEDLQGVRTTNGDGANDAATGDDFIDIMNGSGGNDTLNGGVNNDTLNGGADNDWLLGGSGADALDGGDGADQLYGNIGDDTVTGGGGDDVAVGAEGKDAIAGGLGRDFLFGASFSPDGSFAPGSGDDTLNGDDGDDGLWGGDGLDILNGGVGNDALVGGAGNDTINGGGDNDFLFGGDFSVIDGSRLPNSGDDMLSGGSGNDALYGFDGNDIINGEAGNEYVEAGEGDDVVNGGADSDTLLGQAGNDTISGGIGFDYLYGGAGADIFSFRKSDSYDTIWDFSAAQGDKLRLDPTLGVTNFAQFQAKLTGFTFDGVAYTVLDFPASIDKLTLGGIAHTAWTAVMVEFV